MILIFFIEVKELIDGSLRDDRERVRNKRRGRGPEILQRIVNTFDRLL
jgi:hypothetical protein